MAKRSAPEVNAGSMADIAFLLLIFFLVTTTIATDSGLNRDLPPIDESDTTPPIIKQKNIFTVLINKDEQLLVEDEIMELKDLRAAAIAFLDNNGDGTCTYCKGARDPESSDNPDKAIISLVNDRETNYETYIAVQDELVAAYNVLRNREAQRLFKRDWRGDILAFYNKGTNFKDAEDAFEARAQFKEKYIKPIKDLFPQKLSEAEPKTN